MNTNLIKRALCFLLTLALLVGYMPPVHVHAEEIAVTEPAAAETAAPTEAATEVATENAEETAAPTQPAVPEETAAPTAAATEVPVVTETAANTVAEISEVAIASGTCGENLTWVLDVDYTLTISGTGAMNNYTYDTQPWKDERRSVGSVIIGAGVTSIGNYAFAGMDALSSVTIGSSVTKIGDYAFHVCSGLSTVKIPDSVISIGAYAFQECVMMTAVTIGNRVTSIGDYAFSQCSRLTSAKIPNSVIGIGDYAFYQCLQMPSITIPDSVVSIGDYAFATCSAATSMTIGSGLTSIGMRAFSNCDGLTNITIPDNVTQIGDYAFAACTGLISVKLPDNLKSLGSYAFYSCITLPTITIPRGLTQIADGTFYDCMGLTSVTIPKNITSIGREAFAVCKSLNSVHFLGNAPSLGDLLFMGVCATVYYPAGNSTWTEEISGKYYGGDLTWNDGTAPKVAGSLSELTALDYMAFSVVAYENFRVGETVEECLTRLKKWDKVWGKEQITYGELCANIAAWEVFATRNLDTKNGFYAVAFQNKDDEALIAFRGSVPLDEVNQSNGLDAAWDWLVSDLRMQVLNVMEDEMQSRSAFRFYEDVLAQKEWHRIDVTGHSLGGGLANMVSARYRCKGVTMNAISVLDAVYEAMPAEMGRLFYGVDNWNFMDHANMYDVVAGMWEHYIIGDKLKPVTIHKSNLPMDEFISCHGMSTYVTRNSGGDPAMQSVNSTFVRSSKYSNSLDWLRHVNLGTTRGDTFSNKIGESNNETSYGGNGNDIIHAGMGIDRLIGGQGGDTLDGGWGDDFYLYYKGDGVDTIKDTSGDDTLYLLDFFDNDVISVYDESEDSKYIYVLCNGEIIIQIHKEGRAYKWNASEEFRVSVRRENGTIEVHNITEMFKKSVYGSRVLIGCPVSVEVLDAEGNVVYALVDGEVGSHYTEYGNFYVFEEEDGRYGKVLDLVEGYTARIVGEDTGTMEIEYRDVTDGELSEQVKAFADVPVSVGFAAIFEETEVGELVLSADTDGDNLIDTKIGYDGKPVPVESIALTQEYIALEPDQTFKLQADVKPAELSQFLSWSVEESSEDIISISQDGTVTGLNVGTAYVLVTVENGDTCTTARCRVDVTETEIVDDVEVIELDGVQLSTQKLTTELYSTNYAGFEILLQLPQNYPVAATTYSLRGWNTGVMMEAARFADPAMAEMFEIVVLDDRSVLVIPTDFAVYNPKLVANKYTGPVAVVVQGKEYYSENLTLTVKKTMPKLKASVAAFNSFYSFDSKEIVITGATLTAIYPDESKNTAIPYWLTLSDGALTLTENAPLKSASGKAYVKVETEEWRIPVSLTLSVKNTYKAPGLKLSASSVTLVKQAENSDGVTLKLICSNKKDTLDSLNVLGITAPDGYIIENFNMEDGSFTLKAEEGFTAGKIALRVSFSNTDVTLPLTLTVKTAAVTTKLSAKSVKLNTAVSDSAVIKVTTTPADYRLTAPTIRLTGTETVNGKKVTVDKLSSGELDVRYENGQIKIATTANTPEKASYKLYVSAGGSKEAAATINVISAVPSVTLKAKGTMDLSFLNQAATITPTFKNYSGSIVSYDYHITEMKGKTVVNEDVSQYFAVEQEGKTFTIRCVDETGINTSNTYAVKLSLTLEDGNSLESTISLRVKRTAVKLKLSSSKLSLNKLIDDEGTVTVTCTTKGYDFDALIWTLTDAKNNSAEGQLDISYADGKLTVGVNDSTKYGTTYKIVLKANEYGTASTLTVTVPTEAKSKITATVKVSGKLDVIRDGSAITVTPSYKNCIASTKGTQELFIYSSADKFKEPVNHLFTIEPNGKGGFTITKAENSELSHSLKYKVKLVTTFGNTKVESAQTSMSVAMGAARLTVGTDSTTLFAKDKNDRVVFWLDAGDSTLNGAARVEIKDAKQRDMFEILDYGDGVYAIGFKDGVVNKSINGKTVTLSLNVYLDGNQTTKPNTTVKVKVIVVK